MKWFKHITHDKDGIRASIRDQFGLEGLARYWIVMEEIAKCTDENGNTSCKKTWSEWQGLLGGKRNKLETFLEHLANVSGMFLECSGNVLEMKFPKMLELKDNHTKNLQADKIRIDKNIKESISKDIPKKKGKDFQIPDWVDAEAWDGFLKMRKANKIPNTERALTQIVKKLDEYRSRGDPPAEVLDQSTMNNWRGVFPLRKGNQNGKYKNNSDPDSWAEAIRRASEKEEGNDASVGIGLRFTKNLRQDSERIRIAD